MLHFSCSGASGFAEPWLLDLWVWLLGIFIRRLLSLGCDTISFLSLWFASSICTDVDSLANIFIKVSKRFSSTSTDDVAPLTSHETASFEWDRLASGDFSSERAWSWGLLLNPTIMPLTVDPTRLLSSWLLSRMIKSWSVSEDALKPGSDCVTTVIAGGGESVVGEERLLRGTSSTVRSRCCLSRTTWDWRRA